ncbi:MAG: SDR family NAD(P)-dependent oxidoreductase [Candidatus Lindowbacteria bacterium]|nr:SDR family NAD(P)-dependent oxidoreductase [Candidatus Lindowbacteria bacterium]
MSTRDQKCIFITGVSSGIGLGLAKYYLESDCTVFGLSRRTPKDLIKDPNFFHANADLHKLTKIPPILKKLLSQTDHIDLAILNAGVLGEIRDMRQTDMKWIHEIMDVNVWSNKMILDCFVDIDITLAQVVAISSGASINGSRGWNAYALSKTTLNMLMALYAKEITDTHFCSFAPGLVDTAMQDYLCALPDSEEFPALEKLKAARGTESMPKSDEAGKLLANAFEQIKGLPSGSFADIRNLPTG